MGGFTRNRRYFLSFDEEGPAIRIGIHESVLGDLSRFLLRDAEDATPEQDYGFKTCERDLIKGFGFANAFETVELGDEYLVLSGKLEKDKGPSAYCASLKYLTDYLNAFAGLPGYGDKVRHQLLLIRPSYRPWEEMSGFMLEGSVHPKVVRWCRRAAKRGESRIFERAMWLASNALREFPVPIQEGPNPYMNCIARFDATGRFFFDFGDAAGVYVSGEDPICSPDNYVAFACSNADGPLRQIAWLAALAKLHDLVDANIAAAR